MSTCPCGRPEPHLTADPESDEAVCRVPDFDRATGRMATGPPTITAFLEQRIAEDEAVARAAAEIPNGEDGSWWVDGPALKSGKHWVYATGEKFEHRSVASHIARQDPARVLAQCKTHRAIVELGVCTACDVEMMPCYHRDDTLRALASIWSDHPSYDSRWAL